MINNIIKLSIIIPHYNGIKILTECLDSLHNCSYKNLEILVVDNGSTDNSIEIAKEKFSDVNFIYSSKNRGYAGGCNYGVKFTKGEYLLFLNNDTIHEFNWIEPLIEKLEKNQNISSVQPKILNYDNRDKFDYAGGSGGELDFLVYPFSKGRIFDSIEFDCGQYDKSTEIFWASGTGFITRKSIFNLIGGFDEVLFAHMEEIDYHWRSHLMGFSVYVEPKSIIYHMGGRTLAYNSPEKTYLNHRNSLLLMLTNFSIPLSTFLIFPRLLLEFTSIFRYILMGRLKHSFAQLRAILWILFNLHVLVIRRFKTWQLRTISDKQVLKKMYSKSIVWQYFVRNLKTYSNLEVKR